MSYRDNHIKPKIKNIGRKKIIQRPLFWIGILVIVLVIISLYIMLFSKYFNISHIKISGYETVNNIDIERVVFNNSFKKLFSAGLINIYSNSIFAVNTNNIKDKIKSNYPVIKEVVIRKKLPNTIDLSIQERKSFAVFCQQSKSECFTIDDSGIIFEKLQGTFENTTVLMVEDNNKRAKIGDNVVSKDILSKISDIRNNLKTNFQIDIKEAYISKPLVLKTFENWQIYFDTDSDIDLQITKMNSLLTSEISPTERKNLQYIYLQYKDKAYYK